MKTAPTFVFALIFGVLVGATPAVAQVQIVQEDSPLEPQGSPLPLAEPYTAIDPFDAAHIVVGTIVAPTDDDSPWHCAAFSSFDRGRSWSRYDFDMERCIDPWITFPDEGSVLFTGIEIQQDYENAERFHLVGYRSEDGGRTWSDAAYSLGRTHDHEHITIDRASGKVYMTSQRTHPGRNPHVYVGRIEGGGSRLTHLAELGADSMSSKPSGIVVLSDGSLFVSYQEHHPVDDSVRVSYVRGARSRDGGRPFDAPRLITDGCDIGRSGFPGYPFLDMDSSNGPYGGRLYHACILPDLGGVGVVHSVTEGRSWRPMVRADASSPYARTPMIAVSSDGIVGVAWYDRRHDPNRQCQDVYFTASIDGAENFVTPLRISTETSCPEAPGNGRAGRSWPMGGDYSSLAAGPDGSFHLVWADSRSGHFQLRYAEMRVDADPAGR